VRRGGGLRESAVARSYVAEWRVRRRQGGTARAEQAGGQCRHTAAVAFSAGPDNMSSASISHAQVLATPIVCRAVSACLAVTSLRYGFTLTKKLRRNDSRETSAHEGRNHALRDYRLARCKMQA
jgi:hypothetical protein